jgi:DnaJ-class molecular chaperone
MNALSSLSLAQIESIAATLAGAPTGPAPACGSCHALPPGTGAHGEHTKLSCASCHGSGYSKTTYNSATHANGVVNLVSAIGWTAATRSCSNSCHGEESWKPDN